MAQKALAVFETNEEGTSFTLEVKGVVGPSCQKVQDASKAVGTLVKDTKKPEYNVVQQQANNHVRA